MPQLHRDLGQYGYVLGALLPLHVDERAERCTVLTDRRFERRHVGKGRRLDHDLEVDSRPLRQLSRGGGATVLCLKVDLGSTQHHQCVVDT